MIIILFIPMAALYAFLTYKAYKANFEVSDYSPWPVGVWWFISVLFAIVIPMIAEYNKHIEEEYMLAQMRLENEILELCMKERVIKRRFLWWTWEERFFPTPIGHWTQWCCYLKKEEPTIEGCLNYLLSKRK